MANKLRIKSGDVVVVIAGKDKGKIGKVLKVDPEARRVQVEGVRVVKRHQRPVGDQPGGVVHKEAFVDVSNVAFWSADESRRVKIGFQVVDGKKVRVDRKTGAVLDKE
jgi:large subunit ribosomal protein L24